MFNEETELALLRVLGDERYYPAMMKRKSSAYAALTKIKALQSGKQLGNRIVVEAALGQDLIDAGV